MAGQSEGGAPQSWRSVLMPAVRALQPRVPRSMLDIAEALCDASVPRTDDTPEHFRMKAEGLALGGRFRLGDVSRRSEGSAKRALRRFLKEGLIEVDTRGGRGRLPGIERLKTAAATRASIDSGRA